MQAGIEGVKWWRNTVISIIKRDKHTMFCVLSFLTFNPLHPIILDTTQLVLGPHQTHHSQQAWEVSPLQICSVFSRVVGPVASVHSVSLGTLGISIK